MAVADKPSGAIKARELQRVGYSIRGEEAWNVEANSVPLNEDLAFQKALLACVEDGPTPMSVLDALFVEDIPDAISLARRSYSDGLVEACLETLRFHEVCLRIGLDDGRRLFKYVRNGRLAGVCGLHRYLWGPPDCAWLSWFFIDPVFRCGLHAYRMFLALIYAAAMDGIVRLYVETPSDDVDYASVGGYLARLGFVRQAILPDYYRPGVDMLIFSIATGSWRKVRRPSSAVSDHRELA